MGARRARLRPVQGRDPAGGDGVRHRHRRSPRFALGGARPLDPGDSARYRHGPDGALDDLRAPGLGGDRDHGIDRRDGRVLRGADERPAAAPRPPPGGRWPFHCGENFNENTSILVMIALYSLLLGVGYSIYTVILVYGLFVSATMGMVLLWYQRNHRVHREEVDRLLAFARAEDPHPER